MEESEELYPFTIDNDDRIMLLAHRSFMKHRIKSKYAPAYREAEDSEEGESNCSVDNAHLFFSNSDTKIQMAKSLCESCNIVQSCLSTALRNNLRDGVWGGLTPEERLIYTVNN